MISFFVVLFIDFGNCSWEIPNGASMERWIWSKFFYNTCSEHLKGATAHRITFYLISNPVSQTRLKSCPKLKCVFELF